MPEKILPQLSFSFNGIPIKNVKEYNFLGLNIDSNFNWKAHLNAIGAQIARITRLMRKLKYVFPKHILHSIYNLLIMSHLNYMLLAWGTKCHKIKLLQKRAVRLLYFKSPIAHTKPLFNRMKQPILCDVYTCQLLKLYYKLYRNRLPSYFEMFLPEYGSHRHNLRNDLIRLPAIRCDFGEMNAKYHTQSHIFSSVKSF